MGNAESSDGVKNVNGMRMLGGFLIVLSAAEFGVGGAIYDFMTNVHVGAWWGAVCTFICGVLGLMSFNRGIVMTGCIFGFIGVIVAGVGTIVDGITYEVLAHEKGCVNTDTGDLWGSDEGKGYALECVAGIHSLYGYNYNDYNNYNDNLFYDDNYYSGLSTQCVCSDKTHCYGYDLAKGDDCGTILTTYTKLLSVSPALLAILTVVVFVYASFACMGACGITNNTRGPPAAAPPQYQIQMQQPGAVIYGSVPQQQPQGVVYMMQPQQQPQQQMVYLTQLPQQPQMFLTPQSQQQGVVYLAPTEERAMLGINP